MKQRKTRYSLRMRMMVMNLSIAFISLMVCGVLFVTSVTLIVGKYVSRDLDFILTEASQNVSEKLLFMEETIYRIRESDNIMKCLNRSSPDKTACSDSLRETVSEAVNISSEKNLDGWNEPTVESVCLYDRAGYSFSDFYYALNDSDIENKNRIFQKALEKYQKERTEDKNFSIMEEGDVFYFVYPLYNDNMDDVGTLIFEVNKAAVSAPIQNIMKYQNSFWALYGGKGIILFGGDTDKKSMEQLKDEVRRNPYTKSYRGMKYRIFSEEFGMNLGIVAGMAANQSDLILYDSLKMYVMGIMGGVLAGLAGLAFFTYQITRPLKEVAGRMEKVKEGDFEVKLPEYESQEFYEISTAFNEMTEYINHLVTQVYEKQLSIKEMELKFFQSQMNPHFMFNVLSSIALQAKLEGNEEIFRMLSSFAQLIRAKIYRDNSEKVRISQELEYVEYYLYLQSFRFGDRLCYEIQVEEEEILEFQIPKLCIQLIVENAVVHGIEPKIGNGQVTVRLRKVGEEVFIDITDNGIGFGQEGPIIFPIKMEGDSSHNHVGLNNAHNIIQLMYGEAYGLSIVTERECGSTVTIHIPADRI